MVHALVSRPPTCSRLFKCYGYIMRIYTSLMPTPKKYYVLCGDREAYQLEWVQ